MHRENNDKWNVAMIRVRRSARFASVEAVVIDDVHVQLNSFDSGGDKEEMRAGIH